MGNTIRDPLRAVPMHSRSLTLNAAPARCEAARSPAHAAVRSLMDIWSDFRRYLGSHCLPQSATGRSRRVRATQKHSKQAEGRRTCTYRAVLKRSEARREQETK